MIAPIRNFIDRIRGNGRHAITTPPMDGVLQPNTLIEDAPLLAPISRPDNLVRRGEEMLFSSGNQLMRINGTTPEPVEAFPHAVNALAASTGNALAIALMDGSVIVRGGKHDGFSLDQRQAASLTCITALCFSGEDRLHICQGSHRNPLSEWKRDLMERNAAGSVWTLDLSQKSLTKIASDLAFPYGILADDKDSLVVSESWQSRLISIDPSGNVRPVLEDLPGYPARLAPQSSGRGAWLSVFAPRSQLIEFVLREDKFRADMMRSIPSDLWMAPSLTAPHSFLEPLQGGGLKQLGVMKPWAPTRSFGLIISLDENFAPVASWHSRADGTRHGITSVADRGEELVAGSLGGDALVSLRHSGGLPA
ncbi:hypothetical protein ABID16_004643 [Rhizobium aquaticum]|uniref:Strictosidine synthase conserved region domain-containing protein n=1 Tax=Rhizobium aquaticum TaxID=1549636 RepID=A0ABV2J926_9HYPH